MLLYFWQTQPPVPKSSVRLPPYNPSKLGHFPYLMPPTHINMYLSLTITVGFKVWTPWGPWRPFQGVCGGLNCFPINTNISSALFHCVAICTDSADPLAWVKIVTPNCMSCHCSLPSPWTQERERKGGERKMWIGWFWKMNGGWGGAGVGENKTKAWKTVQLLICFSCFQWREARWDARAYRIRERVEIHPEKQRSRHKGSCVPLKEYALKA